MVSSYKCLTDLQVLNPNFLHLPIQKPGLSTIYTFYVLHRTPLQVIYLFLAVCACCFGKKASEMKALRSIVYIHV